MTSIDFMELYRKEKEAMKRKKQTSIFKKRNVVDLNTYKLKEDLFYLPNFISEEEEAKLIKCIYQQKETWVQLSNRRLQNWGGVPYHGDGMIKEDFPLHFQNVAEILEASFQFSKDGLDFNQVLFNEYSHGKGIDFHKDGPLYKPCAVVLSLMAPAVIEFRSDRTSDTLHSILLEPRSLLIFRGDFYTNLVHGIRDLTKDVIATHCLNSIVGTEIDRGDTRLSLTIRSALKVKDRMYTDEESSEIERRKNWWLNSINEKKIY
jgi:alkylated DNA repair protein alkB family protein 6